MRLARVSLWSPSGEKVLSTSHFLGTFGAVRHFAFAYRQLRRSKGIAQHAQRTPILSWPPRRARRMRILFATPEVSDFIQVGGLAAVSAALPRALRDFADIRLIIPGYPAVLAGIGELAIVGRCPAHAGLPAFEVGLGHAADGLTY
jgi:hypothetical protein